MKSQYKDLIERSNRILSDHHDMDANAIAQEHGLLQAKLVLAEDELIEREDECETDDKHLSEAIVAVNKVSDVREMHTGGSTTQF